MTSIEVVAVVVDYHIKIIMVQGRGEEERRWTGGGDIIAKYIEKAAQNKEASGRGETVPTVFPPSKNN